MPLVDVGASRKDADIVVSIFFAVVGIQNSIAVNRRRSFLSSDEDTDQYRRDDVEYRRPPKLRLVFTDFFSVSGRI